MVAAFRLLQKLRSRSLIGYTSDRHLNQEAQGNNTVDDPSKDTSDAGVRASEQEPIKYSVSQQSNEPPAQRSRYHAT